MSHIFSTPVQAKSNLKSFPSDKVPQGDTDLHFLSPQPNTSLHCKTTNMGLVHRAVCLFKIYEDTHTVHCTYPRRDGQAELTFVVGRIPRRFTPIQAVTT